MKGISEPLAGRIGIVRLQSLSNSELMQTGFGPFIPLPEELHFRNKTAPFMPVNETFLISEIYKSFLNAGMEPPLYSC